MQPPGPGGAGRGWGRDVRAVPLVFIVLFPAEQAGDPPALGAAQEHQVQVCARRGEEGFHQGQGQEAHLQTEKRKASAWVGSLCRAGADTEPAGGVGRESGHGSSALTSPHKIVEMKTLALLL